MSAALAHDAVEPRRRVLTTRGLRNASVWMLFASGWLVFIEPAPFEIAFAIVFAVFLLTGLTISML